MIPLLKINCLATLLTGLLLLIINYLSIISEAANTTNNNNEAFPDIFSFMLGKDRFRIQYEMNSIVENKRNNSAGSNYRSMLVDESFSFSLGSGRLMIDSNGLRAGSNGGNNFYNIFYWFRGNESQESYWLKPFICSSAYTSLKEKPMKPGILASMLPGLIQEISSYSNSDYTLHGISGLLANIVQNYNKSELKLLKTKSPTLTEEDEDEDELILVQSIEWQLDISNDLRIEFSFTKDYDWGESLLNDLSKLKITFIKLKDGKEINCIAQVVILKIDLTFDDRILMLPQGYSCSRSIKLPKNLLNDNDNNNTQSYSLATEKGLRKKYTFEVTVVTPTDPTLLLTNTSQKTIDILNYPKHFSIPAPEDSIKKPKSETRKITLIVDDLDKNIVIISPLKEQFYSKDNQPNSYDRSRKSSLSVWNFLTMRKHVVYGQTGSCNEPTGFKSSLFASDSLISDKDKKPVVNIDSPLINCPNEGVELELSDNFILKLNKDGLKMLQFTLTNRKNNAFLIDYYKANNDDDSNKMEFVYEMITNDKFCLYRIDENAKNKIELYQTSPIRLVTKYIYTPPSSTKNVHSNNRKSTIGNWMPKSSSILIFHNELSRLLMKININLLHYEDYKPWDQSKHLYDLSSCFLGPKQAAKVTLDYPLTIDNNHLKQFESPHKLIRQAISTHMRVTYSLTTLRIPSIDVEITNDLIQIKLLLLDQSHILSDSNLLPITKVPKEKYMEWLTQSLRSVLLSSLRACAEYCQYYNCEMYTYCKFSLSCYIYSNKLYSELLATNLFGSYESGDLSCASYQVITQRSESANYWRKSSWSLSEILDSLVNAINKPLNNNGSRYSNIGQEDKQQHQQFIGDQDYKLTEIEKMLVSEHRLSVTKPNLELSSQMKGQEFHRLVRLNVLFAHYKYENLHNSLLFNGNENPFFIGDKEESNMSTVQQGLTNFRIALGGYEFYETKKAVQFNEIVNHIDLDDSDGYIILEEHNLEECAKVCLTDLKCSSFSYCTTNASLGSSESPNCIISKLNQRGIDTIMDSIMNDVPIEDTFQSFSTEDDEDYQSKIIINHLTIKQNSLCSIMMRTYSDQFQRLELKMLFNEKDVPMSDVISVFGASTAEQCATSCLLQRAKLISDSSYNNENNKQQKESNNNNEDEIDDDSNDPASACLSYDFCRPFSDEDKSKSACILYNRHLVTTSSHKDHIKDDHIKSISNSDNNSDKKSLLDTLRNDLNLSIHSFCYHYVRNFLTDFHKINHRRLPSDLKTFSLDNYKFSAKLSEDDNKELSKLSKEDSTMDDKYDFDETTEDISLVRCARLCEEDPDCGAFEYCIANYRQAPGGVYLSCSLGNNETLELSPATQLFNNKKPMRKNQKLELKKLLKSTICSVYVYKSISLILGHKKKNLIQITSELLNEVAHETSVEFFKLIRTDMILLFFFLVLGFIIRDIDINHIKSRILKTTARPTTSVAVNNENILYGEQDEERLDSDFDKYLDDSSGAGSSSRINVDNEFKLEMIYK